MEWMLMPLKRYADFSGRSRRKEYWMFALFYTLVLLATVLVMALGAAMAAPAERPGVLGYVGFALMMLAILAFLVPSLAVQVRRFHDMDKSGWMVLLNLIPYVGGFVVLIMMMLEGTPGPNRYGEAVK
ncbi:DUF805 domain-containing protein [Pseudoxanthomonas sp. JBR18]|uniref:DUF805 domain-containing protein n=1 Tax=Pseudoxanthomonas sp. JBR18 TaxID=2969308 RepID=UPI0023050D3A|nr:DUF805 domain-containing protein [Pseudoxanthomonas sp. JBR18]WCE04272.1 DUF805 domain-containing protein [Pseudoxanthomonas sp. JBR18]